ncbi:MAG: hypothetical protein ACRDU8_00515, partial [Egibacteraceae bacterium]
AQRRRARRRSRRATRQRVGCRPRFTSCSTPEFYEANEHVSIRKKKYCGVLVYAGQWAKGTVARRA